MIASAQTVQPATGSVTAAQPGGRIDIGGDTPPLSLLELELSLSAFDGDEDEFGKTVRAASAAAGAALLFELPASGLVANCRRIAVIRMAPERERPPEIVLALLDADDSGIRVEQPDERTQGLVSLADAFVDVLDRM